MTEAEARAQLARLLADDSLRDTDVTSLLTSIENGFDRLVDGLADEAAQSDDVGDRESALAFVEARLRFFETLLPDELKRRLLAGLRSKIEAW